MSSQPRPTDSTAGPGLRLAQLAEAKGLPMEYLRSHGLRDDRYYGRPAVAVPYADERDVEVFVRHRIALTGDRFRQPPGVALLPYGLGKLATEGNRAHVVLCEGETDALTCWRHDIPALGVPGASSWQDEWARLVGALVVYVVHEPDQGGDTLLDRLAGSSLAPRVMVVDLPGAKDVNEFYLLDPETFRERFQAALEAARPLPEPQPDQHPPRSLPDGWEAPAPLELIARPPAFPTAVLPDWLRAYAEAEAEATQTPPDLAAMLALGTLATTAGGRVVVAPAPDWREGVNLFLAVAMPPGSRKSAVFRDTTSPVRTYERRLADAAAPEIARAAAQGRLAEKRLHALEDLAAKAKPADRASLERELGEAAVEFARMRVPPEPRLFTSDVTSEALGSLLADHGGRFAVLSPEGGVFDQMAGLYTKGLPNPDVYLKGHAGDTLRVDRRGRPSEYVERPALTLCLAVQPASLVAIHANPGLRDRGLLERLLFSVPPDTVGQRAIDPPPVLPEIRARYERTVEALAQSLDALPEPVTLSLSSGARDAFRVFRTELEARRGASGDLAHIKGWASKLDGATARIAGLLHLARHHAAGYERPIEAATLDAAVAIARYLIPHALVAFERMGADARREGARAVRDWIEREARRRFTRRDAQRALQNRFPKVADLEPALELLEDHGFVRRVERSKDRPSRAGRPSTAYDVSPYLNVPDTTTEHDRTGSAGGSVGSVRVSREAPLDPSPSPPEGATVESGGPDITAHDIADDDPPSAWDVSEPEPMGWTR